ncbi:hypothetical protein GsuE55_06400 [Geobacillus subterraneus]|uniref:Uncharacterized protein n=1 Tax=Geobacillus subterraneus TaxID=129338 RepID=A0A679FNJ3_9BACL|nr:hypothetical protein GsuE55_06400 [Geobacillus subterraneus]
MVSLFFNFLFFFLILILILIVVFHDFIPRKILAYLFPSLIFLIMFIPLLGHSTLLLNYQLRTQLDNLSVEKVNFRSDPKAVEEIRSLNHPLRFKILSKTKKGSHAFELVLKMEDNQHQYFVRMRNYTEPFQWLPFNDFQINQVNKVK